MSSVAPRFPAHRDLRKPAGQNSAETSRTETAKRIGHLRAVLHGKGAPAEVVELAEVIALRESAPIEGPPAAAEVVPAPTSTLATRRSVWRSSARPTAFLAAPQSAGALLATVGAEVRRVYLCGTLGDGTRAGLREWCYASPLPPGWSHGAHYTEDADSPILRFDHEHRASLTVLRAESWFGDPRLTGEGFSAAEAERAFELLARTVADHFDGAGLNDTPGTTGRRAFARLIPAGVEWPVLPAEVQSVLHNTSGQGRIELLPRESELPALYEYDGRLMYGALLRELGTALVAHDDQPTFAGYQSGWYRVRATVPADWEHVGILPAMAELGWRWPSAPGETFDSWCSGAELSIALANGWRCVIAERLLFGAGKPLDGWQRAFIAAADRVDQRMSADAEGGWHLVRKGLRAILLHAIGAFHGRPRSLSRSVALADAHLVPTSAVDVRVEGDRIAWNEQQAPAWPEMSHPEWATQIWARARARLLMAPLETGALRIPHAAVIAFRTDAIYTDRPLDWRDDGAPGRYRLKRFVDGPMPAPRSQTELLAMREGL